VRLALPGGKVVAYELVGALDEADARQGRLSVASPVGHALVGGAPGDTVEVHVPSGTRRFSIIAVEAPGAEAVAA
jgi:transcription elongation factor GreA